jgi:hypothetical protein
VEPEAQLNESFAALGLVVSAPLDLEDEFFLWPENVVAFDLWLGVQTQWNIDSGKRTGLNYPGVQICLNNLVAKKKERPEFFMTLQAMERTALDQWSEKR